jgi:hypothetical protein
MTTGGEVQVTVVGSAITADPVALVDPVTTVGPVTTVASVGPATMAEVTMAEVTMAAAVTAKTRSAGDGRVPATVTLCVLPSAELSSGARGLTPKA